MSYIGHPLYVATGGPQQIGGAIDAVMVNMCLKILENPNCSDSVKAMARQWLRDSFYG